MPKGEWRCSWNTLQLYIESLTGQNTVVDGCHGAITPHKQGGGQIPGTVCKADVAVGVTDQLEIDAELLRKCGDDVDLLPFVDADDPYVVAIDRIEIGHFTATGLTPGGPKIDNHPLPAEIAETGGRAIGLLPRKIRGECIGLHETSLCIY